MIKLCPRCKTPIISDDELYGFDGKICECKKKEAIKPPPVSTPKVTLGYRSKRIVKLLIKSLNKLLKQVDDSIQHS